MLESRTNIKCVNRRLMNRHQIEEKQLMINAWNLMFCWMNDEWIVTELIMVYHRIHDVKGLTSHNFSNLPHLFGFYTPGSEGGLCPPAHYCPGGSASPLPCPAGTYTNLTGQSLCSRCPAGYYCPEKTGNFTKFPCPPGFYCPDGRLTPTPDNHSSS